MGLGTCSSFPTRQPVCIHNTFMGQHTNSLHRLSLAKLSTLIEILNCWGEKTPNSIGYSQGLELPPKPPSRYSTAPGSCKSRNQLPFCMCSSNSSPRHQLRRNIWLHFMSWKLIKNRVYHPYKLISGYRHYSRLQWITLDLQHCSKRKTLAHCTWLPK